MSKNIGQTFEWPKWKRDIPYLQFPHEWEVKIIPPFASAVVRFVVKSKDKEVSVYLDGYNLLGFYGLDQKGEPIPYWEIYPDKDGDIDRFDMNDTDGLLKAIREALEEKST